MYNILNNYKRLLLFLIKWAIVAGALYYIYQKVMGQEQLSLYQFQEQLLVLVGNGFWWMLLVLLFTDLNWFLEVLKWQKLVQPIRQISLLESYIHCLSSLTVAVLTPNKIGEYGAKALYFKKAVWKHILVLNLVGNGCQFAVTLFFGAIGMFFLVQHFSEHIASVVIFDGLIFIGVVVLITLFSWNLLKSKYQTLKKVVPLASIQFTFNLSFLRYLVFSHQFIVFLYLFGVEIDYFIFINLLFCMYVLASIIPTLALFDWAIKGSIAVWLFGFVGVDEFTILTISALMWLLNVAIPSVIGAFFVLKFKPVDTI